MSEADNTVTGAPPFVSLPDEAGVLQRIITDLTSLPEDSRRRLIDTVCVFLGLGHARVEPTLPASHHATSSRASSFQFSEDDAPSVKQFMHDKNPQTDVERVACLAYYLARYRAIPHVKTKDITELNNESAHRPFS